jgi:protein-tyrosine-phosphatase
MHNSFALAKPPVFLKLLSHDLRWQLLKLLSSSDLRVQELVDRLHQPQNLISYHLQRLRKQGLVHERRSSSDGREVYYSLDLDRVRALYQSSGQALHPALAAEETSQEVPDIRRPVSVLFLCTHNSARSQMAEGILRARGAGQVQVFSAGTEPGVVHPMAVHAMQEMNIDIQHHRSKHMDEFLGRDFDYVITVCDRIREVCPLFPGDPVKIHWSFPDPAAVEGNEELQFAAFKKTALQLNNRITYLLLMIQRGWNRPG